MSGKSDYISHLERIEAVLIYLQQALHWNALEGIIDIIGAMT